MRLSDVVNSFVDYFKTNLQSVLLYGSSTTSVHPADIDIIIVLKRKESVSKNLQFLKRISRNFPDVYFDLQLMYAREINDPDTFSLDSHGCFFYLVLKEAQIFWGMNPFIASTPNNKKVVESVVRKLQYYVFRARQMFLGETYRSKDKNPDFHRKKLLMAMVSILLCKNPKPSSMPLDDFVISYPEYLKESEIASINNDANPITIETAMPIYEKLYDLALDILAKL
jgi:hypothetical protein